MIVLLEIVNCAHFSGGGLWSLCLMPLSTIFELYHGDGGQFYWWRKPECLEKTTDLLTNLITHSVVSSTPRNFSA